MISERVESGAHLVNLHKPTTPTETQMAAASARARMQGTSSGLLGDWWWVGVFGGLQGAIGGVGVCAVGG